MHLEVLRTVTPRVPVGPRAESAGSMSVKKNSKASVALIPALVGVYCSLLRTLISSRAMTSATSQ